MSKIAITCTICGKIFYAYKCQNRKLCSKKCRHKYQSIVLTSSIKKKCKMCGKEFDVLLHDKNTRKFCSLKCFNSYRKDYNIHTGKKTNKYCIVCGEKLNTGTKFCSRTCMGKQYEKLMVNENNPNWKGGDFTRENSGICIKLRNKVLERDNFTCQECGFQPTSVEDQSLLHCHHLKSFSQGGKTTSNNLTTLCIICHWEGKHGYKLSEDTRNLIIRSNQSS